MFTAQQLILRARAEFNDGGGDHFVREQISQLDSTGQNTRFALANRNIVDTGTSPPAPANPVILVDNNPPGPPLTPVTINYNTGIVNFNTGPGANLEIEVEYFFVLVSDLDYLHFLTEASSFVGTPQTFTAITDTTKFPDLLDKAVVKSMAGLAAKKMSNLSSWYYQAQAGNKSFNKTQVANNFRQMAIQLQKEAMAEREDVYTRHSQRNAPAYGVSNVAAFQRPYTPRR